MNKNPLVSVIIPNYNHSKFLEERINSVLLQSYNNLELIILDDNSTDCSVEIINKFRNNEKVRHVVINPKNSGSPFIQWEKGIELALGKYIWIAESDDSCEKGLVEILVRKLEASQYCSLAYCKSNLIDVHGRNIGSISLPIDDQYIDGNKFLNDFLFKLNVVSNASAVLFRRDAINNIDKDYKKYKGSGDWIFWMNIVKTGSVYVCGQAFNKFRIHGNNTTQKLLNSGDEFFEARDVLDYEIRNFSISPYLRKKIRRSWLREIFHHRFPYRIEKKICLYWKVSFMEYIYYHYSTSLKLHVKRLIK